MTLYKRATSRRQGILSHNLLNLVLRDGLVVFLVVCGTPSSHDPYADSA